MRVDREAPRRLWAAGKQRAQETPHPITTASIAGATQQSQPWMADDDDDDGDDAVPLPSSYSVGEHVECLYDGGDEWYEAKITATHSDGTYDVIYTDDDVEETQVPLIYLRPNPDAESSDDGDAWLAAQRRAGASRELDFAELSSALSPEALAALAGHLQAAPEALAEAGVVLQALPTEEELASRRAAHEAREVRRVVLLARPPACLPESKLVCRAACLSAGLPACPGLY
jgi:hypothetical protein